MSYEQERKKVIEAVVLASQLANTFNKISSIHRGCRKKTNPWLRLLT